MSAKSNPGPTRPKLNALNTKSTNNIYQKEKFEIFKQAQFEDEQLIRYILFQLGKITVKGTTMTKWPPSKC
jgi:hypothetical protein